MMIPAALSGMEPRPFNSLLSNFPLVSRRLFIKVPLSINFREVGEGVAILRDFSRLLLAGWLVLSQVPYLKGRDANGTAIQAQLCDLFAVTVLPFRNSNPFFQEAGGVLVLSTKWPMLQV